MDKGYSKGERMNEADIQKAIDEKYPGEIAKDKKKTRKEKRIEDLRKEVKDLKKEIEG